MHDDDKQKHVKSIMTSNKKSYVENNPLSIIECPLNKDIYGIL